MMKQFLFFTMELLRKPRILLLAAIGSAAPQKLGFKGKMNRTKICDDTYIRYVRRDFELFRNCTIILGNVRIVLYARMTPTHFEKLSFPDLREITGYLMFHNIAGLRSVGQLFPNLARVRGEDLIGDHAVMLTDMPDVLEVGLYSLIKIDRGGLIVWNAPNICYVHSINWTAIAPEGRHVLEQTKGCKNFCKCKLEGPQYCWNNIRCQTFLEGPDAEKCHEQCLGCARTDPNTCTLCKYHTFEDNCVSTCPNHTVVLERTNYCLTLDECKNVRRFAYNGSCISECPYEYRKVQTDEGITCEWCAECDELKTCDSLVLKSLQSILTAERCGIVNGSIEIHLFSPGEVMAELRRNLKRIREVTDYIFISSSAKIDSLDFFSSLRRIRGNNLESGQHALKIKNMDNLRTLFTKDVRDNLKIDKGTFGVSGNPKLCAIEIMNLVHLFPVYPDISVAPGDLNGYSAGCIDSIVDIFVNDIGFKSATVLVSPIHPENGYTLLYSPKIDGEEVPPPEKFDKITCHKYQWVAVQFTESDKNRNQIRLTKLKPATTYAVCVEIKNLDKKVLVRSEIRYFDTRVGRPPPPFISEIVAVTSSVVRVRWVNHIDYVKHITHYELDVQLIDFPYQIPKLICTETIIFAQEERHAHYYRTPDKYQTACYGDCNNKKWIKLEEKFDINDEFTKPDFSYIEPDPPGNSSIGKFVKTASLVMHSTDGSYNVKHLAPFSNYRIILRSCTLESCSTSTREVVQTKYKEDADVVDIVATSLHKQSGQFTVKWKPPKIVNGPAYSYEVHVREKYEDNSRGAIFKWCLTQKELQFFTKLYAEAVYETRVCTITLAPRTACTEFVLSVIVEDDKMSPAWLYGGVSAGILLIFFSIFIASLWTPRANNDIEMVSLVGAAAANRTESDPPLNESDTEII